MDLSTTNHDTYIVSKLHVLTEVATTLAAHLELFELLQSVTEKIVEVMEPAELALVLLWDPATGSFLTRAVAGVIPNAQRFRDLKLLEHESITGAVFDQGKARVLVSQAEIQREFSKVRPTIRSVMADLYGQQGYPNSVIAAPLFTGEHRFGVLVLETLNDNVSFDESDLPFVQALADLIALEIDRARLDDEAAAARKAREADRMRSEVMASLSHELRTPLAAIKGYATALMLEEVDWPVDKRSEFLRLIDQETDNLEGMIRDILDSSLIDVGQFAIIPQPVRLPRLAQQIADEMQHQTQIHRFVIDFPADFPIVDVDPGRIRQVFRNILDNAIKYSPNGGLIVIQGLVRADDVVVSIADQGVGISPEDLIPLFDKYFRVKAPAGYYIPGTGLGLPVSRAIIEAHGGHIWAESKVGEGTRLFFSIKRDGPSSTE